VQDEKNGAQQETPVPGTGASGRAVRMRGGQRTHVHTADRADVRHRQAVHRARVLDGVRHAARQVRVSHQPQRRRVLARAVPGAVAVLHRGHTTGHRRPVAHLLATTTPIVPGKSTLLILSKNYIIASNPNPNRIVIIIIGRQSFGRIYKLKNNIVSNKKVP